MHFAERLFTLVLTLNFCSFLVLNNIFFFIVYGKNKEKHTAVLFVCCWFLSLFFHLLFAVILFTILLWPPYAHSGFHSLWDSFYVQSLLHSVLSSRAAQTYTSNRIHFQFMHCRALNSCRHTFTFTCTHKQF